MAPRRFVTAGLLGLVLAALLPTAPAQATQVADASCPFNSPTAGSSQVVSYYSAGTPRWAQSFTAQSSGPPTRARFAVSVKTVTTMEVGLFSLAGPSPTNTTYPNSPIAATTVDVAPNFNSFGGIVDVSFPNPATVAAGTSYALVVKKTSGISFDDFAMGVLSRDACTGYPFRDLKADDHWAVFQDLNDIAMELYVGTPDPGPTTPPAPGDTTPPAPVATAPTMTTPPAPVPPTPPPATATTAPPMVHDDHTILSEAPFTWDGIGITAGTSAPEAGNVFVRAYTLPASNTRATTSPARKVLIANGSARVRANREVRVRLKASKALKRYATHHASLKILVEARFVPRRKGGKAIVEARRGTIRFKRTR